jgi:hypothetical protein
MVMRPDRCAALTPYAVNNRPHDWLHGLRWVADGEIADLPAAWNWLDGWSDPAIDPKIVHYTRGTPDMPGYETTQFADDWRAALRNARQAGATAAR